MASLSLPQVDFRAAAAEGAADARLREAVRNNTLRKQEGREARWTELPDAQALRELAARIKQHTLENLDYYLRQLVDAVRRNGGVVHRSEERRVGKEC